jgi:hypothetical protein
MAEEYQFTTLDAREQPQAIQRQLRRAVGAYLSSSNGLAPQVLPPVK